MRGCADGGALWPLPVALREARALPRHARRGGRGRQAAQVTCWRQGLEAAQSLPLRLQPLHGALRTPTPRASPTPRRRKVLQGYGLQSHACSRYTRSRFRAASSAYGRATALGMGSIIAAGSTRPALRSLKASMSSTGGPSAGQRSPRVARAGCQPAGQRPRRVISG